MLVVNLGIFLRTTLKLSENFLGCKVFVDVKEMAKKGGLRDDIVTNFYRAYNFY